MRRIGWARSDVGVGIHGYIMHLTGATYRLHETDFLDTLYFAAVVCIPVQYFSLPSPFYFFVLILVKSEVKSV